MKRIEEMDAVLLLIKAESIDNLSCEWAMTTEAVGARWLTASVPASMARLRRRCGL